MAGERYFSGTMIKRGSQSTLKPSTAETVSATHSSVDTADSGVIYVEVICTAASGTTPTLLVVVEGSIDTVNWFELGTLGSNGYRVGSIGTAPANITGAVTMRAGFPAIQYCRTRSIVGGTSPSFTYSVRVEVS